MPLQQRRTDLSRLAADGSAPAFEVARTVNALIDGRSENHGLVTLAVGTTLTLIKAPVFTVNTVINLVPTSAAAAAVAWWQLELLARGAVRIGHADPGAAVQFRWTAHG